MNRAIIIILFILVWPSFTQAKNLTYCGRVQCAPVLDGCQITDNKTNPIVLINDEGGNKYHYVSDSFSKRLLSLDSQCACVTGTTKPSKGASVPFNYFFKASKVTAIAEQRCAREGL